MFNILNAARQARADLNVVCIFHDEVEDMGNGKKRKIRTIGKMLDSAITVEGLFTIVLFSDVSVNGVNKEPEYKFLTQTDGVTTAKAPRGMFPSSALDNDLGAIIKMIEEYYN